MANTKVTFVTGTAEVRRKDPSWDYNNSQPTTEQRMTTEPSRPLQVVYVDGKCTCCPYGYHIDLDFLNFCRDLERGSTLKSLKRIQRTKRKLRKSMEVMLGKQEGIAADPNSAPPDVVHSTEAGRLMHLINYERSATHNILQHIDSSVGNAANYDTGSGFKYMSSDSDESTAPYTPTHGTAYPFDDLNFMATSYSTLERTDSFGSLSSESTLSNETPLPQQTEQHYSHSTETKTTTKVMENPVIEMGTAEMKHYSTSSSAQLADIELSEPDIRPFVEKKVLVTVKTPPPPISIKMSSMVATGRTPPATPIKISSPAATAKTPPATIPKTTSDTNQLSLQSVREAMAVSLQRMRELEEQVKTIPILQVRISVLKEEKRLLNLQLKASKSSAVPMTTSVGVGDNRVDIADRIEQSIHSARNFEFPKSYFTDPASSPIKTPKTPPVILPKPAKTYSVGVGDHSVVEPYNLQPDLPTGYTVHENETSFEIHSRTVSEKFSLPLNRTVIPSLSMSFQQSSNADNINREGRTLSSLPTAPDPNQPLFTINQIQRTVPKPLTRTVGTGDGNVLDESGLHVHEKELRTVIIGQNNPVAKRNVGIECRVATRDVGVLFKCDEAKPETRTVGVNVNYDTSDIHTSLDFKGETELRLALRDVLKRNVRSVATNCNFKPASVDEGTITEQGTGISIGCGDEENRINVEVRPVTVRKSVSTVAKPETGNKCVSTEADWVLDAATNTYQADTYHKSVMTDKLKQSFAATLTDPTLSHTASCQTEHQTLRNLDLVRHSASNTDKIPITSTGISTDSTPTVSTGINTTEKVSDLFQAQSEQKPAVKTKELKSILKKPKTVDSAVGDGRIERAHSETIETSRITKPANKESNSFMQTEYSKKSSRSDDIRNHLSSTEVSTNSSPLTRDFVSSREDLLHSSQEDLVKRNSAFERVSPTKSEDRFSETVVEHYIITNNGKTLISEEKMTTSPAGTNRSFIQYTNKERDPWSDQAQEPAINSGHGNDSMSSSSSTIDEYASSSGSSYTFSGGMNGNTVAEKNYASVINNPYMTVENLAEVSLILDSEIDNGLTPRHPSKTVSQDDLYRENRDKKFSHTEKTSSVEAVYDMRRAGSVEDFMPDDIRRYMSIDPSASKDSGFGEDLVQRFSEGQLELSSKPTTAEADAACADTASTSEISSVKSTKIITRKCTTTTGDTVVVQEAETVEGPDGQVTTIIITDTSEEDGKAVEEGAADIDQDSPSLASQNDEASLTSSTTTRTHSSRRVTGQGGSDSNISFGIARKCYPGKTGLTAGGTKSFSETTMTAVGDSDDELMAAIGNYGSLDRKTGKLKSIMKRRSSDSQQMGSRKGITFAESVTGGTGSSSQEDENTSDSDSTTSYDEGSYDGQRGQVIYYCKDDEAITQGLPGAQMFDQNIRETYELPAEVRDACNVLATYFIDSISIQTKQLNASQGIIQQEWFQVSSHKLSQVHQVEDFLSSVNEISKKLLEYIINTADSNGNTAIHYSVSHCNFEIASLLLDSEVCDTNKQNKAGYTPIMLAGLATLQNPEHRDIVKRLFSLGEVNSRATSTQQTALMLAASHGRTEMVKLLVEEGADINLQDEDGSTALMCACEHGYLDIVNFLLAQPNIDANIVDNENSTALSIAMEAGHKDVGVVLYKHLNFSKAPTSASHRKRRSSSSPIPSNFVTR